MSNAAPRYLPVQARLCQNMSCQPEIPQPQLSRIISCRPDIPQPILSTTTRPALAGHEHRADIALKRERSIHKMLSIATAQGSIADVHNKSTSHAPRCPANGCCKQLQAEAPKRENCAHAALAARVPLETALVPCVNTCSQPIVTPSGRSMLFLYPSVQPLVSQCQCHC